MNSYSKIKRDLWFGVLTFCFAVFFGLSSVYTIRLEGESGITSRTFPYIITALLLVLSILLTAGAARRLKDIPAQEKTYQPMFSRAELTRVPVFLITLVLYVFSFIYVGFLVSTAAYMAFLLWFMHAKNKLASALIVLLAPGLLWFFFTKVMEINFPEALLL